MPKERKIKMSIEVTEEEYAELKRMAAACHCKRRDLIEAFVADLTESDRTNGSDERMFAREYYDRLGWEMFWE